METEYCTVDFEGKQISVLKETEVKEICSGNERDALRKGDLIVLMNGIRVDESALLEIDCRIELKKTKK